MVPKAEETIAYSGEAGAQQVEGGEVDGHSWGMQARLVEEVGRRGPKRMLKIG